jgi:serine/threonine-protein kinase
MTTAFATSSEYVAALSASGLVGPADLERAERFVRTAQRTEPRDLAAFLIKEGVLTRFQADYLIEGRLADLSVGNYTLVDILGTGAMGTVYKAVVAKDKGHYVVKIVPRRNVVNLKVITDKVQALKQVRHPRVSALVNIGASGERVYLAWPFLEGGQRLTDMLGADKALPARQVAQLGLQIASGLQPYHERGLFHGLLKTSDILIGADRRVRVLDFGVGFLLTSERGKAVLDTMTNGKTLFKGLDTASPEAIQDSLARSPAGDQYSLGCILYRCLTGRYPFPYDNPVEKMVAHQNETPEPIAELSPETPPQLIAVVERLMEKDPADRYPDIGEAVKELQALSANSRVFTRRSSAVRSKVAAVRQETEEEEDAIQGTAPSPAPKAAPADNRTTWLVLGAVLLGVVGGVLGWWVMH